MSKLARALCALPLLGVLVAPGVHAQSARLPPAPYERPALVAPANPNQITASISAGATLNGGNTRSYGATAGGRFQLVRRPHQLTLDALFTYTAAAVNADDSVNTTSKNIVGRARYDIYLSDNDALFVALASRHDSTRLHLPPCSPFRRSPLPPSLLPSARSSPPARWR